MWRSGWIWFKAKRPSERSGGADPADMGVEIGLDASLDSMLPPLLNFAVDKSHRAAATALPLGTDLRSHHWPGD